MRPTVRLDPRAAEFKVTVRADSLEELFIEAARVVSRHSGRIGGAAGEWSEVHLTASDRPTLLVDWLNELIGRSEIEQSAFAEVRGLRIGESTLDAEIRGRPVAEFTSPLKAATLHGLELARDRGRWRAEVLFDV